MHFRSTPLVLCGLHFAFTILVSFHSLADEPNNGIEKRPPWTNSKVIGSPDPPLPYVTERAFPNLQFKNCLDLTHAPGSDRLYVVEQSGKIFSFPNREDVDKADLVIDLAKTIPGVEQTYALTFHPNFEKNRYCYVCYIKAANLQEGTHVARFTVSQTDPPTIDVNSETTLLTWLSGGHNGCCLKFGPDGYLYVSTGDAAGPNPPDTLKTGQDISDLLSSILRIDVDHSDEGMNYRIPKDNPFVDLKGARGEIWAYGLRNPWRMSFDKKSGDLWVGDVGWELFELLDRVEKGGNYGWSVMEGRQPTNPEWSRGPTPILPPTIDHPHSESSSITEGLTYYGKRLQSLHGMHIYGDYDTGKFWGFRYVDGQVTEHREIADTTHRVVGFGEDREGDLIILDHVAGTLHRFVPNPIEDRHESFPRKLSETGIYSSTKELLPSIGVVPYRINSELWSDYAVAERLVAIPNDLSIKAAGAAWSFPKDSVLVKTLSLELKPGDRLSRRRIETQLLHYDGVEWQPYTYQWNEEQSDATLLNAKGAEQQFQVTDPQASGGVRHQTWRFAGRAECQRCHNRWSGPALAFNGPQLETRIHSLGESGSQLDAMAEMRLLDKPVSSKDRLALVDPRDTAADLDQRARAYLHANCSHCHRMHAGSSVLSKMHFDLPLNKTDMVGVRPTQGTFGIHAAQVIAAGDPFRSILFYRMAKLGGGRMPHIGSNEIDLVGVDLMERWLTQLPSEVADQDAIAKETAVTVRANELRDLDRLKGMESKSDALVFIDRLLSTSSGGLRLVRAIDSKKLAPSIEAVAIEKGALHSDVNIRELFERFLPVEKRVKRLGSEIDASRLLAMSGDPVRGKALFMDTSSITCKNCHRIQNVGTEVGPDLSTIGKKLSQPQILESILEPSKLIDPKYVTHLIETKDGEILTGLIVSKDERGVVLKNAQNKEIRVEAEQIEQLVQQRQSLMPEMLLREMTSQQVADLVDYLSGLK